MFTLCKAQNMHVFTSHFLLIESIFNDAASNYRSRDSAVRKLFGCPVCFMVRFSFSYFESHLFCSTLFCRLPFITFSQELSSLHVLTEVLEPWKPLLCFQMVVLAKRSLRIPTSSSFCLEGKRMLGTLFGV